MTDVFQMVPAPARAMWFFAAIGVLLLGLTLLFAWFAWSAVNTRFEVTGTELRIRSALYGRTIPLAAVGADQARVVDLGQERGLRPTWRRNGIGLPGYGAGWFSLADGSRALAFVTARHQVVHVPTTDGYVLLLSVREPQRFVESLRRAGGGR